MFENESEFNKTTERIVADMISANLAQKKVYTDNRIGQEYINLITPNAFKKNLSLLPFLDIQSR